MMLGKAVAALLSATALGASASVSICGDETPSVRYAADELREHLGKLVIAKPDVDISIGLSDDPSLGDDGFEINSSDGVVSVRGGKRGVIYGLYELLERYGGVVWTSPDYTHIPEDGTFSVPDGVSLRETPAFAARYLSTFTNDITFASRCRLNEYSHHHNTKPFDECYGGPFPPFDEMLGKCHTFQKLVSADRYYATHPEYFSLVNGRRERRRPQLCLTNPDVFNIALSNVIRRIEANRRSPEAWRRSTRYYGVSQDDWNNYCECPSCAAIDEREESHSGCVIWFVNKIAEEVEKRYPNVVIETLAYMYSRKPPKYLRPRDNVMVCLCTIECDFSKPMAENRYKENVDFRENVLKWRDIANHLYIWDYAANWRATPVPYPNLVAYAKNVRFYHDAGVRYLYEEGFRSPPASFTDLKGWLGAKLMWNPFQPAAPLVRRFCEAYYGKGAPFVMEFIRLMGEQEIDETKTPITYAVPLEEMPFSKEFYLKGRDLWAKAFAAVADESSPIRRHVAWGRFGLEYALAGLYSQTGDWKAAIISRETLAKLDRDEYTRMRESARYCQRMIDLEPRAMVSSRLNDARLKGYLKALAQSEFPEAMPSKVLVQEWPFDYDDYPKSKTLFREKDADATDGSAILVRGETRDRSVYCPVQKVLALDRGCRYRMRARIKAQKKPNAPAGRPLMTMELFDRTDKRQVFLMSLPPERATGGYEWYDFGEWTDEGHKCMININPCGSNFSFDCLEVSVVFP